ncbi:hypothetical protein LL06_19685 [Hoeflea sp. BAL378]|uniref:hydroxypyruvate isomerase family protein n=1 Tax=Hoeflea sp. BAL378 TaxID=1547437 RepID=UPI000513DAE8|nr:TIM barrel protein [Hoeflea sp. BAL378]KGF67902.1 hypothetical protein LL06_19685 [Hoeflea sp. BAL378]
MLRLSANLSTLFGELPFLDRFAAARRAGFMAVEVQYPYAHAKSDVAAALADSGLDLVLVNAPPGLQPRDRGLAAIPGRETEFRDGMELALSWSSALGNRFVHVLSGVPGESQSRAACLEVWQANMDWAAEQARAEGVELLLEALNPTDVPGYFVRSLDDALALLGRLEGPNVGLLFDVYHCARAGEPVVAQLHACAPWTRHIQIADAPARGEPGTGEIDWKAVFSAIAATGYRGFVGAEYSPRAGTLEGLGWARPHLENS